MFHLPRNRFLGNEKGSNIQPRDYGICPHGATSFGAVRFVPQGTEVRYEDGPELHFLSYRHPQSRAWPELPTLSLHTVVASDRHDPEAPADTIPPARSPFNDQLPVVPRACCRASVHRHTHGVRFLPPGRVQGDDFTEPCCGRLFHRLRPMP